MASLVQPWKEQQIEQSEKVSDVLEVALAYGVRLSEWVIIACLLAGLFMTLPGVRDSVPLMVSNAIIGLQMFALDIAGLGLIPIEKHARMNGNLKIANSARWMIGLLITITITTSLSFTIGHIVPETVNYTDKIDFALILVRVVISIFFKMFMGTVRTSEVHAIPVAEHENSIQELLAAQQQQVQNITEIYTRQMAELRGIVEGYSQRGIQQTATLLEQMQAMSSGIESMGKAIAESQKTIPPLPPLVETKKDTPLPLKREGIVKKTAKTIPLIAESKGVQIKGYIQTKISEGYTPTLPEIVAACGCSKVTAIRYRKEILEEQTA